MSKKHERDSIQVIDEWFQSKCDGQWEHRFGVDIVTCDNPGWRITFSDMVVNVDDVAALVEAMRRQLGAEITIQETTVEIFARSLQNCLTAAARLIEPNSRGR